MKIQGREKQREVEREGKVKEFYVGRKREVEDEEQPAAMKVNDGKGVRESSTIERVPREANGNEKMDEKDGMR